MIGRGSPTRSPDSRSSSTIRVRAFAAERFGELVVGLLRARRVARFPARRAPGHRASAPFGMDHGAHRQRQLAPPGHVGDVAERADHRDAAALLGVGERVGPHGHGHAEERRLDVGAEERLVALVVGMRDERDARRDQLRPRRLDLDGRRRPDLREANPVIRARLLAVLELRLRHGRAEVHVPQRRRLELIGGAALQQPQERRLRHPLRPTVDRGVGHRPVDRQAEVPPQVLERLLVLRRQPVAELDEVRARDRDRLLARLRPAAETPDRTGSDGSQRTP